MEIIIRKAKSGEGNAIIECFREFCVKQCGKCYNKYLCNNKLNSEKLIKNIDKNLATHNKSHYTLVAYDSEAKRIVGFCTFSGNSYAKTSHRLELGWSVNMQYAGNGIATKMVRQLVTVAKNRGFKRLEAEVAVENTPSIKLAKRLGFKIEGRKRSSMYLNKKYIDTYIFGKIL